MISESDIEGPYLRDGGSPGMLATLALAALGGGLVFSFVPIPSAWWVSAALVAAYVLCVRYLISPSYTWVDGSTIRSSSRRRDKRLDLTQLVEVSRPFVPQLGYPTLIFKDHDGTRIDIAVIPATEALRHEIGRHLDLAVWYRARTDPRAVAELGL